MTVHRLKVWPDYYGAITGGAKRFEVRKDDREPPFEEGDLVALEQWDEQVIGGYTGNWFPAKIVRLWRGGAMPGGYCAFSFTIATGDDEQAIRFARQPLRVSQ